MFPEVWEEDEDITALAAWGLPGYSQLMATPKAAGKPAKKSAAKPKGRTKK